MADSAAAADDDDVTVAVTGSVMRSVLALPRRPGSETGSSSTCRRTQRLIFAMHLQQTLERCFSGRLRQRSCSVLGVKQLQHCSLVSAASSNSVNQACGNQGRSGRQDMQELAAV
jgi:hypothetical protein